LKKIDGQKTSGRAAILANLKKYIRLKEQKAEERGPSRGGVGTRKTKKS